MNVRWLAAAAALLVAAGTAWLGWRASPVRVREVSGASTAPTPLPSASPAAGPARIIALALAPGLVRGEGGPRRVTLPAAGDATLRLILTVPASSRHERHSAVIESVEGATVWSGAAVTGPFGGRRTATVDVPAERIPEGDYEVVLRAVTARGRADVAEYALGVLRD